ncbi:unnamed protein product [Rhodiola kirilowii]
MSMVGELTFFLGLQIQQEADGTQIHQQKYLKEVLLKYELNSSKTISTPSSPADSLSKEMNSPPTDQTKYQADPREAYLKAIKRIMRYLNGTKELVLWYPRDKSLVLEGFSDADYAGDRADGKSTSGMAQFLGSCLVSWGSKKQNSVALSTTEAEYVACSSVLCTTSVVTEPAK